MNASIYPLTLLYDGLCPVCTLEMDHLRERDAAGRLTLIDFTAPGFDPAPWGSTLEAMNAEIHGYTADGRELRGMAALREAYAAVGLGWVLEPTGIGPLRPLFDLGYRGFARHRRSISRLAAPLIDALRRRRARHVACRMASCRDGACAVAQRETEEGGAS